MYTQTSFFLSSIQGRNSKKRTKKEFGHYNVSLDVPMMKMLVSSGYRTNGRFQKKNTEQVFQPGRLNKRSTPGSLLFKESYLNRFSIINRHRSFCIYFVFNTPLHVRAKNSTITTNKNFSFYTLKLLALFQQSGSSLFEKI